MRFILGFPAGWGSWNWHREQKQKKAVWGKAQMAKCWLSRPKNLNLIPRTKETKRPCVAACRWNRSAGETRRRVTERERHLKLTSGIHMHMNPCVQHQHSHMHSYIQPPGDIHTNRKVDCLGTFLQITLHHDHTDGLQVNKPGSSQSQAW